MHSGSAEVSTVWWWWGPGYTRASASCSEENLLVPSLPSPTWLWSCVLTCPWPRLLSPEDAPARARGPALVKPLPELRLRRVFSSRLCGRGSFSCSLLASLLSFFQHSHFKIGYLYILQKCGGGLRLWRLWPQLGTYNILVVHSRWQCFLCNLLEDLLDLFIFI